MIAKTIAAAAVLLAGAVHADSFTGPDKAKHLAGSAAIAAAVTLATESERAGFWASVAIGAAKEIADSRSPRHTASLKDLAADVAGAYIGSKAGAYIVIRRNQITVTKVF
ncbi:MAG: putative periplasmic lipoprotein [Pseudomonadota bacterium]|jgi:uncharacterized protein YfiM (DUF2279 family)